MCTGRVCLEDAEPNLFQQGRGLVTPGAWAHFQVLLPLSDACLVHGTDTMVSVSRDVGTGTEQGSLVGIHVPLKSRLSSGFP